MLIPHANIVISTSSIIMLMMMTTIINIIEYKHHRFISRKRKGGCIRSSIGNIAGILFRNFPSL